MTLFYDQSQFDVRCEWGERGVAALAPVSDVVIIVDVLSFSTCVDVATANGAVVFSYRWRDSSAAAFAESKGAALAGHRKGPAQFSLSPTTLQHIAAGTRLVLPSPNGSTLSFSTGQTPTLCGCLRNRRAIAGFASRLGRRIAVIAAGERWEDDSLRPAVEDWIGAGAIIHSLPGPRSPEAAAAAAAFQAAASDLSCWLRGCASGREMIEQGWERDIQIAAELDASGSVPLLTDGAYINQV